MVSRPLQQTEIVKIIFYCATVFIWLWILWRKGSWKPSLSPSIQNVFYLLFNVYLLKCFQVLPSLNLCLSVLVWKVISNCPSLRGKWVVVLWPQFNHKYFLQSYFSELVSKTASRLICTNLRQKYNRPMLILVLLPRIIHQYFPPDSW